MQTEELARAWSAGVSAIGPLLAEHVVFEVWSDELTRCRGRAEVIALLRGLVDPQTGRLPGLAFEDLPGGLVLASLEGGSTTVVLHRAAGSVARMVQYPSRHQAIEHLANPEEPLSYPDGTLSTHHPLAVAATAAIHSGDIDALRGLLADDPQLATVRLGNPRGMARTLLHVVTDWPGHYPRGAQTVAVLAAAGADVNARFTGPHTETPLHWAASSDDVAVLDALLDAGADIEADGAVIGGGTALADATAFGQWNAARRLVERGARTRLGEAAALGLVDRIRVHLAADGPTGEDLTSALWMACHGGQPAAAELLLQRGADLNWIGYDDLTPLDAAVRSEATDLVEWLRARGARTATAVRPGQPAAAEDRS
jgi:ankyrin repeat protein